MEIKIGEKIDINKAKIYLWEKSKKISNPQIILYNEDELSFHIGNDKAKAWNIHLGEKERVFVLRKLKNAKESILVEKMSDDKFFEWTPYIGYFKVIKP